MYKASPTTLCHTPVHFRLTAIKRNSNAHCPRSQLYMVLLAYFRLTGEHVKWSQFTEEFVQFSQFFTRLLCDTTLERKEKHNKCGRNVALFE